MEGHIGLLEKLWKEESSLGLSMLDAPTWLGSTIAKHILNICSFCTESSFSHSHQIQKFQLFFFKDNQATDPTVAERQCLIPSSCLGPYIYNHDIDFSILKLLMHFQHFFQLDHGNIRCSDADHKI
jgi:hypothetical protein